MSTAAYPTHPLATAYPLPEGWRIGPAGYLPGPSAGGGAAAAAHLAEADATPTQAFPVHPLRERPARAERRREARRRHLGQALAGVLIAVALLTSMQLYAAQGISQARQAALAQRDAASRSAQTGRARGDQTSDVISSSNKSNDNSSASQTPSQPEWVTSDTGADTGAAYDRTDPSASPLSLPRCTTSPDTPLPCLATISPDSRRAVVLEEDASLTALVRR